MLVLTIINWWMAWRKPLPKVCNSVNADESKTWVQFPPAPPFREHARTGASSVSPLLGMALVFNGSASDGSDSQLVTH